MTHIKEMTKNELALLAVGALFGASVFVILHYGTPLDIGILAVITMAFVINQLRTNPDKEETA